MPSQQKVSEIYVDLVARTAKFKAALHEAESESKRFGKEMKAHTEEANGSLELLGDQLGVRLPRHLRSFVAELPGVSQAMSAAFNAIAIVGIIQVLSEAGEKLAKFIEKSGEAARKNREAWSNITGGLQAYDDSLKLTNDKIEDSIAKLEHKPTNRIKEAIDEAIVSAETLGQKLDADVGKITEALKAQQVGVISRIAGNAGTSDITEHAQDLQDKLADINTRESDRLHVMREQHATQKEINEATKQFNDLRREAIGEQQRWVNEQLQKAGNSAATYAGIGAALQTAGVPGSLTPTNDERFRLLNEFKNPLGILSNTIGDTEENNSLQNRQKSLEDANDAASKLLKANQEQLAALKHAREQMSQAWTPADDLAFWESHASAFKQGSDQYKAVQQQIFTAQEAMWKAAAEARKRLRDSAYQKEAPKLFEPTGDGSQLVAAQTKDAQAQALMQAQLQLTADKIAYAKGQINAYALAVDEARIHDQEYAEQIADLRHQLDELHQNDFPGNTANTAKEQQVQTQINVLQSRQRMQQMQDAQNEFNNTWKGSITGIYDTVIAKSQQTMQEVQRISQQFIEGVNDQLARGMTGERMNFSGVFRGVSQSLAKASLEKVEGSVLKQFGMGKADGSQSSPYWVQMAKESAADMSPLNGIAKGILDKFGGSGSGSDNSTDNSSRGSGFGGFLKNIFSMFGGGHAMGGDVLGGMPVDVGELGPERFVPYTNGRIVPHNEVNTGKGPVYIDARGSHDPAQTEAAVHRAMGKYLPHAAVAGAASNHEWNARRPSTSRR